ncbi:MAG: DUF2341 domain-containing protein, partial [Halobacteriota archaeon]|nr:DUF2341 domain-containing protein [Halobacteriota archaeon]
MEQKTGKLAFWVFFAVFFTMMMVFGGGPVGVVSADEMDDWNYQSTITIDNNGNTDALTDYQVLVELDNTNFDFSQAQPEGDDIRFTNQGVDQLPYWIEDYDAGSETAKIWVKVDSIPASSTKTIIMHYGNAEADPVSDGDNAFEFFDDFETDTIGTDWKAFGEQTSSWSISDGIMKFTDWGIYYQYKPKIAYTGQSFNGDFAIDVKAKVEQSEEDGHSGLVACLNTDFQSGYEYYDFYSMVYGRKWPSFWIRKVIDGDNFNEGTVIGTSNATSENTYNTWEDLSFKKSNCTIRYECSQGGSLRHYADAESNLYDAGYVGVGAGNYAYPRFDDFRVRKYTSPEPTVTVEIEPEDLLDWNYQSAITIDNTGNTETLTDYQVLIELDNTNFDFSQAQPDGDDIRFTNQGVDQLPYWIEDYDAGLETAKILVKVDSIPASGTTTITMYFGNTEAESMSSGTETFEFFDDFEDGNFDGWVVENGAWSALNNYLTETEKVNGNKFIKTPSDTVSAIWNWGLKYDTLDQWQQWHLQLWQDADNYYYIRMDENNNYHESLNKVVDGTKTELMTWSWSPNTNWHDFELRRDQNGNWEFYIDGSLKNSVTDDAITNWNAIKLNNYCKNGASTGYSWDDIRVRKYTSPEPTVTVGDTPILTAIVVSPPTASLNVGETQQFTATGYDQYDNEMPEITFTWSSSDEVVGTVSSDGLFTAAAPGSATVTAESGGVEGSTSVTVSDTPIPWPYQSTITIDNTGNTEALTDYQVIVELDSSNFEFSQAQPDGDDIRFANQGGDELPYWIEDYDAGSETAK